MKQQLWRLALLGLLVWSAVLVANGRGFDFFIYREAALRLLSAAPLYQPADGAFPYKYAPTTVLLFVPFAWLPAKDRPECTACSLPFCS